MRCHKSQGRKEEMISEALADEDSRARATDVTMSNIGGLGLERQEDYVVGRWKGVRTSRPTMTSPRPPRGIFSFLRHNPPFLRISSNSPHGR